MTDKPDEIVLICLPLTGDPRSVVVGSIKDICSECQQGIWVSPSSRKMGATKTARRVCMPCGLEGIAKDGNTLIARIQSEQITEIKQHRKTRQP